MVDAQSHGPLVSVGVPTYNREHRLRRAVESILAQDYPHVEVVISDNASADGTQAWCEELCCRDSRVRYVRQPRNVGLISNYAEVFRHSRGDVYMALADDDWLEPNYITECLRVLLAQPDLAAVCGKPRMFRGRDYLHEGRKTTLLQDSAGWRVLQYLGRVEENVPFHALMRREVVTAVPTMSHTLAADWIYIASIVFRGKVRTLDNTAVNKGWAGTSYSWESQVRAGGLPSYQARIPYLAIIAATFKNIAWVSPVYESCGRVGRFVLACKVSVVLAMKLGEWGVGVLRQRWKGTT